MPYTMKVDGMDKITAMLKELGEQAGSAASAGLYDGAGVMADEIKENAKGIKTAPRKHSEPGGRLPTPAEKAAVLAAEGSGIARFKKDQDGVNTSVGYAKAGYVIINGRRKPIPLIANAINSGTSFMKKQAFFRRAVNRGSRDAEAAIIRTIEAKIDAITKENGGNG